MRLAAVFPNEPLGKWVAETLYSARGVEKRALAIGGLIELPTGELVASDVASGRLLIKQVDEEDFAPLGVRRFRPSVPAKLEMLSDTLLLSTNWSWFQITDVETGASRDVQPPITPWGTRRAGEFILSPDRNCLVVAPSTSGPYMTVLATSETPAPALTLAPMRDLEAVTYFGPPIHGLGSKRSTSLEERVSLAGWTFDSLVVVRLYDATISVYAPGIRSGALPSRQFKLPAAFEPQSTSAEGGNNITQPQLAGAALLADGNLMVLRHVGYRWRDIRPWRRIPGFWWPEYGIELYSLSGKRLASTRLPKGFWRGPIASQSSGGAILIGAPGDGDPRFVMILRFAPPSSGRGD